MAELTLEALEKRVAALERKVAKLGRSGFDAVMDQIRENDERRERLMATEEGRQELRLEQEVWASYEAEIAAYRAAEAAECQREWDAEDARAAEAAAKLADSCITVVSIHPAP